MKKFVALPLILLFFGATAALAQMETASPMWVFGANVGYGLPMGDFKDGYTWKMADDREFTLGYDGALSAGVSGCYMFTDKYGVELAVDWNKFPVNDVSKDTLTSRMMDVETDANFQFIPVTVDFLANFPVAAPIVPYVKGGLGIYFWKHETDPETTIAIDKLKNQSGNDFGFNLGVGIKYPVAETTILDVGARFHNIMTEDTSIQYFTFTAGVGFMF